MKETYTLEEIQAMIKKAKTRKELFKGWKLLAEYEGEI